MISLANEEGCYVWLMWIEGGSRYVSKSVYVDAASELHEFRGFVTAPGTPIQT